MWFSLERPWFLLALLSLPLIWILSTRRMVMSNKGRLSRALHMCIAALLTLALCGLSMQEASRRHLQYLILDQSDSVDREAVALAAGEALENAEGETGIIVFGANALVEKSPAERQRLGEITSRVDGSGSDLAAAMRLARALIPGDAMGGIGVITDGRARLADNMDVPVNLYLLEDRGTGDVQVSAVTVPEVAYTGQSVRVQVQVDARRDTEGTLYLYRNGSLAGMQQVRLYRGENRLQMSAVAEQAGLTAWEARVVANGDEISVNDRKGAVTRVLGSLHVAVVESRAGEGAELRKMLESVSAQVDVLSPSVMPEDPTQWMQWQTVCLVNVDMDQLDDAQVRAMDTAVRTLGQGLVVFGGDSSYALGGYRGSVLENLMPVTCDVRNRAELPTTALLLVIDKSGSMADSSWGVTRLDVAKEAASEAVSVLTEKDLVGVISFDDMGSWVVPMTRVEDRDEIRDLIGSIRPEGGTAFYTPLAMAYDALKHAEARYRHVIFLTDGEAADSGYDMIIRDMQQAGITLTTVAVGDGADTSTLSKMARLGAGRAYVAGQFDNVPRIFTKETMLIAKQYVQSRTFTPAITDSTMTDFVGFPVLDGYLATTEKEVATVSLVSDRGDPILAWWQAGAGRCVAFTSDVSGGWTGSFLRWDDAPGFFGGMIGFAAGDDRQAGTVTLEEGKISWTLSEPMEGEAAAEIRPVSGEAVTVQLTRTGARQYVGEMPFSQPGTYTVSARLMDTDGDIMASAESGVVIDYSREYDLRDSGGIRTADLSAGLSVVDRPGELLKMPETRASATRPLSVPLLIGAMALLMGDIAQRRLRTGGNQPKKAAERPSAEKKRQKKTREDASRPDRSDTTQVLADLKKKREKL